MRTNWVLAAVLLLASVLSPSAQAQTPDPSETEVYLEPENWMYCLVTCPAGDTTPYESLHVIVRDDEGEPIPGIQANAFAFATIGGALTFDAMPGFAVTDGDGLIKFSVGAPGAIAHPAGDLAQGAPVEISVSAMGVQFAQHAFLTCRTVDYNLDGHVDPIDFTEFASHFCRAVDDTGHYGCLYVPDAVASDFNDNGRCIEPTDFAIFAAHFGCE